MNHDTSEQLPVAGGKPPWLKVRLRMDQAYDAVSRTVAEQRLHTVCHSVLSCFGNRQRDTFRVDVDADSFATVRLGCGHDSSAVTTSEVVDNVVFCHSCKLEHLLDDICGVGTKMASGSRSFFFLALMS